MNIFIHIAADFFLILAHGTFILGTHLMQNFTPPHADFYSSFRYVF